MAKVRVFYTEAKFLRADPLNNIRAQRNSDEHSLREIIRLGQREGTFAAHLDPTLTAIAILAILNSVQQWFRPDGPRTLDQVTASFTDLILRSVGAASPTPAPLQQRRRPASSKRR